MYWFHVFGHTAATGGDVHKFGGRGFTPRRRRIISTGLLLAAMLGSGLNHNHAFAQGSSGVYSAQLHVHSSFSEGRGSLETELSEARDAGVDVMWWSDHDIHMKLDHKVSHFTFENWEEVAHQDEDWAPRHSDELSVTKSWSLILDEGFAWHEAEITHETAYEGSGSMRMSGEAPASSYSQLHYQLSPGSHAPKRSLATDMTINIAVRPAVISVDARPVIRLTLSWHIGDGTAVEWDWHELHYVLDNTTTEPFLEESRYVVPLPFTVDQWTFYELPVSADAIEAFGSPGEDNTLYAINIGLESRNSATAEVYFDDFQIHQVKRGGALYQRQGEMLDSIAQEVPDVVQLQGVELSLIDHLNEFSEGTLLPDYDSLAIANGYMDENGWIDNWNEFRKFAAAHLVEQTHTRGGVVSYNHLFSTIDTGTPQDLFDTLYATAAHGADLLEVGYRDRRGFTREDYFWVWDELTRNQLYMTGTGVSDSHGLRKGQWGDAPNNFVSWIYAESPSKATLIDGLRRGRVYFGDITLFDGTVELTSAEGFTMGQVVYTDRDSAEVTFHVEGLIPGDRVETIWNGSVLNTYTASGNTFVVTEKQPLDSMGRTFARLDVINAAEVEKVFSNPICFTQSLPAQGLASARTGIQVGDMVSMEIDAFHVDDISVKSREDRTMLSIEGTGDGGSVVIYDPPPAIPAQVLFKTLSGTWVYADSVLTITGIEGTGTIRITSVASEGVPGSQAGTGIQPPDHFYLAQNYPNPFNPSTSMEFGVGHSGRVRLEIYDISGQHIRSLVNEHLAAGRHRMVWDGHDGRGMPVTSGVYFYRLTAGDRFVQTRKMLLVR